MTKRRVAMLAVGVTVTLSCQVAEAPGLTVEYIAHAAFLITGPEGTSLLVDPAVVAPGIRAKTS